MPPQYGPRGLPFQNQHLPHLQQHQQNQHHQTQHNGLPPPSLNAGFGTTSNSNASPFSVAGSINSGQFLTDGAGAGLASQAAQMGFARGAPGQHNNNRDYHNGMTARGQETRIKNVWKNNLHQEMANLRNLIDQYPYVAMDTEFPGIVARPIGEFRTKADYHYQTLRCNVDLLKMIQLGIALFAYDGSQPPAQDPNSTSSYMQLTPAPFSWQFNFRFSLHTDMYAQESTTMLEKAGINFKSHEVNGIDPHDFGALLISSGLVLVDDVHWISFHSGYDFGYLMKIMLQKPLPDEENEFHDLLTKFFPSLYDIKYLLKFAGKHGFVNDNQPLTQDAQVILQKLATKSGLQDLADELEVRRVGIAHQAASDSVLTGQIYFKMRERVFGGNIDEKKYSGMVWGLNGQVTSLTRDVNTPNMNGATFYNQNGTPSTPQTGNVALAGQTHTPIPGQTGNVGGHLTPGGGFGNFQYQRA